MVKILIAEIASKSIEKKLQVSFKKAYSLGLRPNHLTLSQLPIVMLMIWFAYNKSLWEVIILSLVMVFIDLFDGIFARATNSYTKLGHLYDKGMDLLSIISLAFSIGLIFPATMKISITLIITTIILYVLNEKTKTELWGGSRVIIPIGAIFNQVGVAVSLSLITTILAISYSGFKLLKKKW